MSEIQIRKAGLADLQRLQAIGRQTFSETFSTVNTEANMKQYLEEGFSAEKLTTELKNPNSEFYLAEHGGEVIGYLKLNSGAAQTELKEAGGLEIERIYVLGAFHGRKVGQLLYEKALEIAEGKDADYIWLGVWEENHRAIGFYQKNGFVAFDKHVFRLGEDEQTDVMMKRLLKETRGV